MAKSKILPQSRPWREWYQLEIWRKRRHRHLQSEPFCRKCLELNLVVPAEIADHIKEHRGDWREFMTGELQSLCRFHHESGKRLGFDKSFDASGNPIDPSHPVYDFERKQRAQRG